MKVQKALPLFRDGGSIILTASVGGSEGFEGFSVRPRLAIRSFARSWTVDLKNRDPCQRCKSWSDSHTDGE